MSFRNSRGFLCGVYYHAKSGKTKHGLVFPSYFTYNVLQFTCTAGKGGRGQPEEDEKRRSRAGMWGRKKIEKELLKI